MTTLTLIIGNKNYSSWSLRPWIFMKQMGLAFNEKRVALFTETMDQELEQYHSDYKVPILTDDGFIVWDSLAIVEFVSEKYLDNKGWPADLAARAEARAVSAEMHSSYINVRSEMPMNCRKIFSNIKLSPQAEKEVERITAVWRYFRRKYADGGDWLFGEYSIADAMFAPIVLRFHGHSIPLKEIEAEYCQTVLGQSHIMEWIEAGKQETEIIEADELDASEFQVV